MTKKNTFNYLLSISKASIIAVDKKEKKQEFIGGSAIGIVIAGKKMYLNSTDVKEIIQEFSVSKVGNTKNWFEGILNIQGEVYSAINMSKLLELSSSSSPKYAIALAGHEFSYALLVDDVLGISKELFLQKVSEEKYMDVYQVGKDEKSLILPQKLVNSPEFMQASL